MWFVPMALILLIYGVLLALLWPLLSLLGGILLSASFLVSLATHVWVDGVLESDDFNEPRNWRARVSDMRYSLAAALLAPSPYLALALAPIWLIESKPAAALWSLLAAGMLTIFQLRLSYFRTVSRKHDEPK